MGQKGSKLLCGCGGGNRNRKRKRKLQKEDLYHPSDEPLDEELISEFKETTTTVPSSIEVHTTLDADLLDVSTLLLEKSSRSVGLIMGYLTSGTGFRVGQKYVMTSLHLVKEICSFGGMFKETNLESPDVYICFNYTNEYKTDSPIFHFVGQIKYANEELDVAVLELKESDDKCMPPKIHCCMDIGDGIDGGFHILGQSYEKTNKLSEMNVQLLKKDPDTTKKAQTWSMEVFYENGYIGLDDPNFELCHCQYQLGMDGSPGIITLQRKYPLNAEEMQRAVNKEIANEDVLQDIHENVNDNIVISSHSVEEKAPLMATVNIYDNGLAGENDSDSDITLVKMVAQDKFKTYHGQKFISAEFIPESDIYSDDVSSNTISIDAFNKDSDNVNINTADDKSTEVSDKLLDENCAKETKKVREHLKLDPVASDLESKQDMQDAELFLGETEFQNNEGITRNSFPNELQNIGSYKHFSNQISGENIDTFVKLDSSSSGKCPLKDESEKNEIDIIDSLVTQDIHSVYNIDASTALTKETEVEVSKCINMHADDGLKRRLSTSADDCFDHTKGNQTLRQQDQDIQTITDFKQHELLKNVYTDSVSNISIGESADELGCKISVHDRIQTFESCQKKVDGTRDETQLESVSFLDDTENIIVNNNEDLSPHISCATNETLNHLSQNKQAEPSNLVSHQNLSEGKIVYEPVVVFMLLRGYPTFYYKGRRSSEMNKLVTEERLVNAGVTMTSVYSHMKQYNIYRELCSDIFYSSTSSWRVEKEKEHRVF